MAAEVVGAGRGCAGKMGGVELGTEIGVAAELDGLRGSGVDGAGIEAGEDGLADDVRDKEEDDLVFLDLFVFWVEKKNLKKGSSPRPGVPLTPRVSCLVKEAGEDGGLAFLELDDLLGGRAGR